jgi:hypothetical protein
VVAQRKQDGKVINWTRPMLDRFKVAYQHAAGKQHSQFEFDGNLFVVGYAKYLIEFLETKFKEPI